MVENGIAEALDVTLSLSSKKQRIAIQGPFNELRIEKENIFKSIAGPVLNPMQDAWQFIQGQECTVFCSGSAAHPQG